jgi:hypothetical protein
VRFRLSALGALGVLAFAVNHLGFYKLSSLLAVIKHLARLVS